MLAAFLTTILWSLSVIFANRSVAVLGGANANLARLTLATLLLGIWAHTLGCGIGGVAFGWFVLSGVIGFGIGDIALFMALPRLGARLSILIIQCLSVPAAATLEYVWLGTRLQGAQVACTVLILGGVAMALSGRMARGTVFSWAGVVAAVVAALGQGWGAVLSRKGFAVAQLSGESIDGLSSAYQRALGGLVLVFVFAMAAPRGARSIQPLTVEEKRKAAWLVLFNALAGPTLGVACYQWALSSQPSGVVLPIVAITPAVTIPFAWWIDGDRPTKRSLLGALIAVAGAVVLAAVSAR